jgi:virulence factor
VRIGFVGTGRHARTTLYPLLRPCGLQLVAVCGRDGEKARAVAETYGGIGHDRLGALLDGGLEGVVVCVPPQAYEEVVTPCLEAGLPVYLEKPGGTSSEQLARMHALDRAGAVVGYMKRFAPSYERAREWVASQDALTSGHVRFVVGPGFGSLENYVVDNAVHALDLVRHLVGEVELVSATALSLDADRHAVSALLRTATGAGVTLQLASTASFFQLNEQVDLVADGHALEVRGLDTVTVRPPSGPELTWRPTWSVPLPQNTTPVVTGFAPALEHFRRVAAGEEESRSDLASAAATLRLAEELLAAVAP